MLLTSAAGLVWHFSRQPNPATQLREQLRSEHAAGRMQNVVELADRLQLTNSLNAETAIMAAKAAERLDRTDKAIEYLSGFDADLTPDELRETMRYLAFLYRTRLQFAEAAAVLQELLDQTDDPIATERLARLYSEFGRQADAMTVLQRAVDGGSELTKLASLLAQNGHQLLTPTAFDRLSGKNPTDPLIRNGMVVIALLRRDAIDAKRLLKGNVKPYAPLDRLQLRVDLQSDGITKDLLRQISERLTASSPEPHPDLLLLAAEVLLAIDKPALAEAAARHCLQVTPFLPRALNLAASATAAGKPAVSVAFRELAAKVEQIDLLAKQIDRAEGLAEGELELQLAAALFALNRVPEARIWARTALRRSKSQVAEDIVSAESGPAFRHPLHRLPQAPLEQITAGLSVPIPQPTLEADTEFRLADVAIEAQLNFAFDNGRRNDETGIRMHEWTGGGIGVIDFDLDAWPDLTFTQGAPFGPSAKVTKDDDAKPQNPNVHHRLFRNARGARFLDCSAAFPGNFAGFGQGVAVGDVNNDGFPDIYVAHTAQNRLLLNQGDGTFQETSIQDQSVEWTTSCAIADVNNDGLPDLYDVNYVGGDSVSDQLCDHEGRLRVCAPTDFPAAPDRIHLNDGAGGFVPAKSFVDLQQRGASSAGMGLLIGRLLPEPGNQVYVANDETANQLWQQNSSTNIWQERAVPAGLAVDSTGQALGSMGITLSYNAEALPQVFVTNYFSEANNLYRDTGSGNFVSVERETGLAAAGFQMLGFGTQFVDLNGDGRDELFVANGHLDDFTFLDHPYRMPAQLFTPIGRQFQPVDAGAYFKREWLGRAVASCDWNRDARIDLAVGHLYDPVSLLQNETELQNPQQLIRLIGTRSAREPVGTRLTLQSQDGVQVRQFTAGDGYQASNQKLLPFARRQNESTDSGLRIEWSSGDRQLTEPLPDMAADQFTVIERRTQLYDVPR